MKHTSLKQLIMSFPQHLLHLVSDIKSWENVTFDFLKQGGIAFHLDKYEFGRMYDNGVLDIRFNSKVKQYLLQKRICHQHHLYKNSGWTSTLILNKGKVKKGIQLLHLAYLLAGQNAPFSNNGQSQKLESVEAFLQENQLLFS